MTANDILAELKRLAPSVAFSATDAPDDDGVWDGDGPDPIEYGLTPREVTVTAMAIVGGEAFRGNAYLTGCYLGHGERLGDIHGYLPQMLDEAADDLLAKLDSQPDSPVPNELGAVQSFLTQEMRDRYEAQSTPIAGASVNPA
jgi:hypothetical protein